MQILVIHGGDAFASYDDYVAYLRSKELTIARLQGHYDWKPGLEAALGTGFEVLLPQMPNKNNAVYAEWKIWFEKMLALIDDELILIGHSLGGCFLARYLATERVSKKIRATFLVAAPYDEAEHPECARHLHNFAAPKDLSMLAAQGGDIFLYQSQDDPVVSFGEFKKYQKALPRARATVLEGRGHINQEEFPELVEAIRSVSVRASL